MDVSDGECLLRIIGPVPTLLLDAGLRFHFHMGDCGEKPHVHVVGKGGAAKIWLSSVEPAASYHYNQHELRSIVKTARQHQADWLRRWREVCE